MLSIAKLTMFFFQGVKPQSLEKVTIPEVKDIIESCIKPNKTDRYMFSIYLLLVQVWRPIVG